MEVSKYIIKSEIELYIHLTITEKCLDIYKGQRSESEIIWCEYIRNYIISGNRSSIEKVIFELDGIYVRLGNLYALSISEATSYLLIFFKHRLWTRYLPAVKANANYFGKHFRMNNE